MITMLVRDWRTALVVAATALAVAGAASAQTNAPAAQACPAAGQEIREPICGDLT